jgi:prevent-host-death family protein
VKRIVDTVPVSALRQDAVRVLEQVKTSNEPLVITQEGRAAAVLLRIEAYEKSEHDRELLHLLAKGEREIAAGEGFDLESVMAEADALLADEP